MEALGTILGISFILFSYFDSSMGSYRAFYSFQSLESCYILFDDADVDKGLSCDRISGEFQVLIRAIIC